MTAVLTEPSCRWRLLLSLEFWIRNLKSWGAIACCQVSTLQLYNAFEKLLESLQVMTMSITYPIAAVTMSFTFITMTACTYVRVPTAAPPFLSRYWASRIQFLQVWNDFFNQLPDRSSYTGQTALSFSRQTNIWCPFPPVADTVPINKIVCVEW